MDHYLPSEILVLVCAFVDRRDLPTIRLVSRRFASAGLPYLTIGEHFFLRNHSLRRLQSIADHPVMHRNLDRITFVVDVVPNFRSMDVWEFQGRALCHALPEEGEVIAKDWLRKHPVSEVVPLHGLDIKFREFGWECQQKIRAEQERLVAGLHDRTLKEAIGHSFAKLPNLKAFALKTFDHRYEAVMRHLYSLDLKKSWYCCNYTCAPESFDTVCLHVFDALLTRNSFINCNIGSNREAALPLEYLCIAATDYVNFTRQSLDILWERPRILQHVRDVRLHTFALDRLVSVFDYNQIHFNTEEHGAFFSQLLTNLPNLESLDLMVRAEEDFKLRAILGKCTWPKLHSLDLANIDVNFTIIRDFLASHAESMKFLQVVCTNLEPADGSQQYLWIELLRFIKDSLKLQHLSLLPDLTEQRDIQFKSQSRLWLNSGISISIDDAARYLVCGSRPEAARRLDDVSDNEDVAADIDEESLEILTWDDLVTAYE
ncbi:MAG: hypothetical protein GOMPHAMPRED_006691 [Gomphillus americanus]|uniref:F-box domain-containing protein n=1 Tax=Gomphillus americanus TaxID=1940652 RepID=A0A8H3FZE4_9LECA|nr:MAG: hypothetical protein GOMPHAMPRED_006691 [Gomphillus americanus]